MGKIYDDLQKQEAAKKGSGAVSRDPKLEKRARAVLDRGEAAVRPPVLQAEGDKDILLERVPAAMLARLEAERARRGLRSRAETIRVLLGEALG